MTSVEKFPQSLIELIKSSKYVHVATCSNDCQPSVALMNYVYVPSDETFKPKKDSSDDYIIFATFEDSDKYQNMLSNPSISLLFHDWIAANNLSMMKHNLFEKKSNASKLENFLQELNQTELNQISATITGKAEIINPLTEESSYYKKLLLRANPDADVFILGENTAVVKVKMQRAKVTDIENNVSIYN